MRGGDYAVARSVENGKHAQMFCNRADVAVVRGVVPGGAVQSGRARPADDVPASGGRHWSV